MKGKRIELTEINDGLPSSAMIMIIVGDESSVQITFTGSHSFLPSGPVCSSNDTHQSSALNSSFPRIPILPYVPVGPFKEKEEKNFDVDATFEKESRDSGSCFQAEESDIDFYQYLPRYLLSESQGINLWNRVALVSFRPGAIASSPRPCSSSLWKKLYV